MEDSSLGTRLRELSLVFLKLGVIGFGGPAAHIALMEMEVVRRRGWLSRDQFLDLVGATNLIPGPNSTELAIHIGRARAELPGLLTAGAAFILPAFFIVSGIAWAYQQYGRLPETAALLHGIKPVVIAIVTQALIALGRTAVKNAALAAAGIIAFIAAVSGVDEVAILVTIGIVAGLTMWVRSQGPNARATGILVPLWAAVASQTTAVGVASPIALLPMFLVFAKAGSLLFGSGYVLLAFLRADLVERLGWLTSPMLDAIVVGRSPGPHSRRRRSSDTTWAACWRRDRDRRHLFAGLCSSLSRRSSRDAPVACCRGGPRRRQRRFARADGERHRHAREGYAGGCHGNRHRGRQRCAPRPLSSEHQYSDSRRRLHRASAQMTSASVHSP
jgi:chromate transport protein ChrA